MKKRNAFIVGLCSLLMFIVITTAVILDSFGGIQEGDIEINGNQCLLLFDGQPLNNMEIPLNVTNITAGVYIEEWHTLRDTDNTNDFRFHIDLSDSWINDTTADWYGFKYGVKNHLGREIFGATLETGETYDMCFWYEVNGLMIIPENGTVHPVIWINATVI